MQPFFNHLHINNKNRLRPYFQDFNLFFINYLYTFYLETTPFLFNLKITDITVLTPTITAKVILNALN